MTELICPVCLSELTECDNTYKCINNHSFDKSRSGYVNLLMSSGHNKRHGDDKLMIRSRNEFLSKGFYDPLAEEIAGTVLKYSKDSNVLCDIGCGECKYTRDVINTITNNGKKVRAYGFDISKEVLDFAAKRNKDITFAVASSSKIPLKDESCDFLLNIFSPFDEKEYARVIKKDGYIVKAYPLEKHLWELKCSIYDEPYENKVGDMQVPGLSIIDKKEIKNEIKLDNSEDIMSLFKMTPYYYKTSVKDQQKAQQISSLMTRCEFGIIVYGKK